MTGLDPFSDTDFILSQTEDDLQKPEELDHDELNSFDPNKKQFTLKEENMPTLGGPITRAGKGFRDKLRDFSTLHNFHKSTKDQRTQMESQWVQNKQELLSFYLATQHGSLLVPYLELMKSAAGYLDSNSKDSQTANRIQAIQDTMASLVDNGYDVDDIEVFYLYDADKLKAFKTTIENLEEDLESCSEDSKDKRCQLHQPLKALKKSIESIKVSESALDNISKNINPYKARFLNELGGQFSKEPSIGAFRFVEVYKTYLYLLKITIDMGLHFGEHPYLTPILKIHSKLQTAAKNCRINYKKKGENINIFYECSDNSISEFVADLKSFEDKLNSSCPTDRDVKSYICSRIMNKISVVRDGFESKLSTVEGKTRLTLSPEIADKVKDFIQAPPDFEDRKIVQTIVKGKTVANRGVLVGIDTIYENKKSYIEANYSTSPLYKIIRDLYRNFYFYFYRLPAESELVDWFWTLEGLIEKTGKSVKTKGKTDRNYNEKDIKDLIDHIETIKDHEPEKIEKAPHGPEIIRGLKDLEGKLKEIVAAGNTEPVAPQEKIEPESLEAAEKKEQENKNGADEPKKLTPTVVAEDEDFDIINDLMNKELTSQPSNSSKRPPKGKPKIKTIKPNLTVPTLAPEKDQKVVDENKIGEPEDIDVPNFETESLQPTPPKRKIIIKKYTPKPRVPKVQPPNGPQKDTDVKTGQPTQENDLSKDTQPVLNKQPTEEIVPEQKTQPDLKSVLNILPEEDGTSTNKNQVPTDQNPKLKKAETQDEDKITQPTPNLKEQQDPPQELIMDVDEHLEKGGDDVGPVLPLDSESKPRTRKIKTFLPMINVDNLPKKGFKPETIQIPDIPTGIEELHTILPEDNEFNPEIKKPGQIEQLDKEAPLNTSGQPEKIGQIEEINPPQQNLGEDIDVPSFDDNLDQFYKEIQKPENVASKKPQGKIKVTTTRPIYKKKGPQKNGADENDPSKKQPEQTKPVVHEVQEKTLPAQFEPENKQPTDITYDPEKLGTLTQPGLTTPQHQNKPEDIVLPGEKTNVADVDEQNPDNTRNQPKIGDQDHRIDENPLSLDNPEIENKPSTKINPTTVITKEKDSDLPENNIKPTDKTTDQTGEQTLPATFTPEKQPDNITYDPEKLGDLTNADKPIVNTQPIDVKLPQDQTLNKGPTDEHPEQRDPQQETELPHDQATNNGKTLQEEVHPTDDITDPFSDLDNLNFDDPMENLPKPDTKKKSVVVTTFKPVIPKKPKSPKPTDDNDPSKMTNKTGNETKKPRGYEDPLEDPEKHEPKNEVIPPEQVDDGQIPTVKTREETLNGNFTPKDGTPTIRHIIMIEYLDCKNCLKDLFFKKIAGKYKKKMGVENKEL